MLITAPICSGRQIDAPDRQFVCYLLFIAPFIVKKEQIEWLIEIFLIF